MDTKKLRQKILDLAIRGKLVPQDPNDEPASVLLERIRAEKDRLIKEGKIKRSKQSATDTPHYENVPFEIPECWEWVSIGSVCEVARGGSPRPIKEYLTDAPNGINWIKIGDTEKDSKYINTAQEKIKPEGKYKSRFVHKGDFLLTNSMSFGHPYILNIDGCIHDGWLVISPIGNAFSADFLYYLLSSDFVYDQFSSAASGGVVSNLNSDKVADTIIPLPPISEQQRIVELIEHFFARIAILEKEKTDLNTIIQLAKNKILDLAIHGKLAPQDPNDEPAIELIKRINPKFEPCDNAHYENLPDGWCVINVGNLANYTNGKAFKPSDWEISGVPIIRIQNLNDNKCKYNYTSITHEDRYKITNGDLLFSWAASLGVYIWDGGQAWLNQHIFKVEPYSFVEKEYLYYLFKYLISEFYNRSHGSGMVHITKAEFVRIHSLLPPQKEQIRIIRRIKTIIQTLDNISASL